MKHKKSTKKWKHKWLNVLLWQAECKENIYVKARLVFSQKVVFTCLDESHIKVIKNSYKNVLKRYKRYFNFCPDLFGRVGKRVLKRTEVNFKIYDVIYRGTNNYKTHIS